MPKVFITKHIPSSGIELLQKQGYEVKIGGSLLRNVKGVDAILCMLTDRIDGKVMDTAGPQLKVISNMSRGLDNIDREAAEKRGIIVVGLPDILSQVVAEHTVALTLAIMRRIVEADKFVRQGKFRGWDPELLLGTELAGKTFGIVGHGRIGCKAAEIMKKGFGMKIIYYDVVRNPHQEEQCSISYASLEQLLKEADVVSLHVPLLPTTRHMIGEKELRLMKPTSYLINTARGAVIDEKALVRALKEKWIAGAGLDVFEDEPKLTPGLTKLDNVILTPHIGSATKEAREKMAELAAQNIINALK